ncbi:unnamed protein product [Pylaiella littoralis]
MSSIEESSGGAESAAGGGDGAQPEAAMCVFSAFWSDGDTEEDMPAPPTRKRGAGSNQGGRTGTVAAPEAASTVVPRGKGGGGSGGRFGSGGGSSGEGRDHNPQSSRMANQDDEEAGQREGMRPKGESSGDGSNVEDSGMEEDALSLLAAGDTDLDDDPTAAGGGGRDEETSAAGSETESSGGGAGAGAEASGEAKHANASDVRGEEGIPCPLCGGLYPAEELRTHANMCLTRQERENDEKDKKEERAKRKSKLAGPRPGALVTNLGFGGGGGPSGGGGRSSSRAKRVENKSKLAATNSKRRSTAKAGRASAVTGKRKSRGDDSAEEGAAAAAAAAAAGGSAADRLIPSAAPGVNRSDVKCPKKLGGISTRGCGAKNGTSAQRCSNCSLRLWEEFTPVRGDPVKFRLGGEVTWLEARCKRIGFVHSLKDNEAAVTTALCTYKNYRGYLSGPIQLKDLSPVIPRQEKQAAVSGNSQAGSGAGSSEVDSSPLPPPHPPRRRRLRLRLRLRRLWQRPRPRPQ